jgi:hypothetical protein
MTDTTPATQSNALPDDREWVIAPAIATCDGTLLYESPTDTLNEDTLVALADLVNEGWGIRVGATAQGLEIAYRPTR